MDRVEINDLRSAIEYLKNIDGQLVKTDVEVDPHGQLAGVYSICRSWWNCYETNKDRTSYDI